MRSILSYRLRGVPDIFNQHSKGGLFTHQKRFVFTPPLAQNIAGTAIDCPLKHKLNRKESIKKL